MYFCRRSTRSSFATIHSTHITQSMLCRAGRGHCVCDRVAMADETTRGPLDGSTSGTIGGGGPETGGATDRPQPPDIPRPIRKTPRADGSPTPEPIGQPAPHQDDELRRDRPYGHVVAKRTIWDRSAVVLPRDPGPCGLANAPSASSSRRTRRSGTAVSSGRGGVEELGRRRTRCRRGHRDAAAADRLVAVHPVVGARRAALRRSCRRAGTPPRRRSRRAAAACRRALRSRSRRRVACSSRRLASAASREQSASTTMNSSPA